MKLDFVRKQIADKLNEVTSTAGKRILEKKEEILANIAQSSIGPNAVSEDIQLLLDVYIASEILYIDCGREKAKPIGYKEFATFIKSICETYSIKEQDDFYARIYSILRDNVTYEEYVAQNLFDEDINNLYGVLSGDEEENSSDIGTNNKELRHAIASKYHEIIQKSLAIIKDRYKYLTGGAFGIKTYAGVLVDANGFCACIKEGTVAQLQPASELKEDYLPYVLSNTFFSGAIQVRKDRQFNYTEMAKASKQTGAAPFYYPYKILELVSKCGLVTKDDYTFTKNTKALNYTKLPANTLGNHANYLKHIVSYFESSIIDYIFTSLYLECLVYDEFKALDAEGKEKYLLQQVTENSKTYLQAVNDSLQFFVNSVTTAIVISDLACAEVSIGEGMYDTKINSLKFMLCVPESGINNVAFVESLAQNKSLTLTDMKNLESTLYSEQDETYQMTDLKYTVNVQLAQGLPDFAYKALAELTKQGVALNWQNILLGNSIQEDLVTSTPGGKISLQDTQVHWIFAGSRSGKGVMCYNIFATAMASGLPIFYMDRKPDTATVMKELAPDMFVVNGNDYKTEIDYKGVFQYSAQASTFKNVPEYFKANTSTNSWFDYAYMRGTLLTLAMICWADMCKTAPLAKEIAEELGSPIIVLDEFTNFYNSFLKDVFHPIGWFGKALSDKGISVSYESYVNSIQKAQEKLTKTDNELNQNALNAALASKPDLYGTYMRGVSDGFLSIIRAIQELGRAGGSLVKQMHFFILGQELNEIGKVFEDPQEMYALQASSSATRFLKNTNVSPLLTTFNNYNHDFIIGANMKTSNIYKHPKMKDYVNLRRRFFAYKKTSQPGHEIQNILSGGTESGYVPFKPFLILNNGIQPPADVLSTDLHPDVETRKAYRKGAKGAVGNATVEALQSSQFVGQCLCNVEEAGLSWEDLLSVNPSEHDPSVLNEGVGFEGYMQKIAQASSVSMDIIVEKMNKSGQIMNKFVQQVFGYNGTWNEFIYDLDPKCIISLEGLDTITGELPVQGRLRSSFLNPGLMLYHPEKYLQDDLATIMYLYTGQEEAKPIDVENAEFDDAFKRTHNSAESEEGYEADEEFEDDEEYEASETSQATTNTQATFNGLTSEQIQQIIINYASKANLHPSQWGNFVNAVVQQLGL